MSTPIPTGILYEAAEPKFSIQNYTRSLSMYQGDNARVYYTVVNSGEASGSVTVRLVDPDGNIVSSNTHELSPGMGVSSYLVFKPSRSGVYVLEAYNNNTSSVDDSKDVNVYVKPRPLARIPVFPLLIVAGLIVFSKHK